MTVNQRNKMIVENTQILFDVYYRLALETKKLIRAKVMMSGLKYISKDIK